jgi:hypothetical protein
MEQTGLVHSSYIRVLFLNLFLKAQVEVRRNEDDETVDEKTMSLNPELIDDLL